MNRVFGAPEPEKGSPGLPIATSLSALARSSSARSPASGSPVGSRRTRSSARLGRVSALGAVISFLVAAAWSGTASDGAVVEPELFHAAPGVKYTPEGRQVRWRKPNTTVTIDASVNEIGPEAGEAIRAAFGSWLTANANLPALTFDTASGLGTEAKPDGKNSVVYAPITLAGHERDLAITLTYSDEKTGDILESDIVINKNFPFDVVGLPDTIEPNASRDDKPDGPTPLAENASSDQAKADSIRVGTTVQTERRSSCVAQQIQSSCGRDIYDVGNVMTHEVGHFFGLGEDMNDTSATMYVCTNRCETHKRELAEGDSTVLAELYPTPMLELGKAGSAAVGCGGARFAPRGLPTGAALLALFTALLLVRRGRG